MITKVTITGADNSIHPKQLLDLSKKYPFVEWGILVSKKHHGSYRFPSVPWLGVLYQLWLSGKINLSCHLCGMYVRDLAIGGTEAIKDLDRLWDIFDRVQINFHGIRHNYSTKMFDIFHSYPEKEFIFQYDSVNDSIARKAKENHVYNCAILYDMSSGAGILPKTWPQPLTWIQCGYSGGLSPDNLRSQLLIIESIVGSNKIWIDMETHVRSEDDSQFDLDKVEECLKIASEFGVPAI
jgi:hypothetical protein